jgi:hypothetical protein
MRRLGLTRKKRTLRAELVLRPAQPDRGKQDGAAIQEERQAWPEAIAGMAVERFVLIDESAARTDLARLYGWSLCGERARGTAPGGSWGRVTILGGLGSEGSLPP